MTVLRFADDAAPVGHRPLITEGRYGGGVT